MPSIELNCARVAFNPDTSLEDKQNALLDTLKSPVLLKELKQKNVEYTTAGITNSGVLVAISGFPKGEECQWARSLCSLLKGLQVEDALNQKFREYIDNYYSAQSKQVQTQNQLKVHYLSPNTVVESKRTLNKYAEYLHFNLATNKITVDYTKTVAHPSEELTEAPIASTLQYHVDKSSTTSSKIIKTPSPPQQKTSHSEHKKLAVEPTASNAHSYRITEAAVLDEAYNVTWEALLSLVDLGINRSKVSCINRQGSGMRFL